MVTLFCVWLHAAASPARLLALPASLSLQFFLMVRLTDGRASSIDPDTKLMVERNGSVMSRPVSTPPFSLHLSSELS